MGVTASWAPAAHATLNGPINGYDCTGITSDAGYQKSGSTVPASLSGTWASGALSMNPGKHMWVYAYLDAASSLNLQDDVIYINDYIWNSNGQIYEQSHVHWGVANSTGDFYGPVELGSSFTGSFNFHLQYQSNGHYYYSVYLDGALVISNIDFGPAAPHFGEYGYEMGPDNPCIDMDGTMTVGGSLSGWSVLDSSLYYNVSQLTSTKFEVYTLSP